MSLPSQFSDLLFFPSSAMWKYQLLSQLNLVSYLIYWNKIKFLEKGKVSQVWAGQTAAA